MFPLKRFIKGPNLHEESVARRETTTTALPTKPELTGDEVKQIYEELINIPEGSSSKSYLSRSKDLESRFSRYREKQRRQKLLSSSVSASVLTPVPKTLNQLMKFCEANNFKDLQEYLKKFYNKVNINEQDIYGWTLLMSAACAGSNECLKLLLETGANWLLCDKKGFTAYDLAEKNHRTECCTLIDDWQDYVTNGGQNTNVIEEESSEDKQLVSIPVYCEACKLTFSNQKEHLKSITHLFSSGVMNNEGKIHYGIPESNVGFQMMIKTGWDKDTGLGPHGTGQKFPVKTILKRNREGVGNNRDKKAARITHFAPFDPAAIKNHQRLERSATQIKREEIKRQNRDRKREINFRRDLSSL